MYQNDTLILTARFAECGEFGGHKEKISIIRTYKNEYFAKIVIDSVNLDCPSDFEKYAIQTKDTLLKINTEKEKAILKYLNKLYKRATTNRANFHTAEYYGASKRGFEIHSDEQPNTWNEFRKLRKTLLK